MKEKQQNKNKIKLNKKKKNKQHNLYKIAIDNNRNFLRQEKLFQVHQRAYVFFCLSKKI